jgi:hypothetical protein
MIFNDAFGVMNGDMPDAILMVADALTNFNGKRTSVLLRLLHLPAAASVRYFRSAMSMAKIRRKIARRAVSRLLQYAIIGLAIVPWK